MSFHELQKTVRQLCSGLLHHRRTYLLPKPVPDGLVRHVFTPALLHILPPGFTLGDSFRIKLPKPTNLQLPNERTMFRL